MGCMKTSCEQCGCSFDALGARGRSPKFCSNACRQRAYRARRVPKVMRDARRWVRAEHKLPLMPSGVAASSTDSSTWSSFADVRRGVGDGFGFIVGGGVACYDLDGAVVDGALLPWAVEFVASIPEPVIFTELSVSGTGAHVFVLADEAKVEKFNVGSGRVERYSRDQFIRCGKPVKF